jgi:UDP-N-acetyl-D-glucosamine/UDP-N-acetyl-D-galactosamine dehydrogenase
MVHKRRISVIGLGYVGLPVAVAFGRSGAPVVAYDIDADRIRELGQGFDRTHEVSADELATANLRYTTDPADLREADFHIVTVPTPITETKRPDLGPLFAAMRTVGAQLGRGDIVVIESTVYPGVTEDECGPILEEASGLERGKDFAVGYSPERINPGDRQHRFETITKVVAGQNAETLEVIARVYGSVITAYLHRAPNIRTAEAAKVIENTQRDLNIALMNELAVIFERLGLDTHDVLAAAETKWNFLKFSPGLVGGHCIGVDPYYLTHRAERAGYQPQVILAGRRINDDMGRWIARETIKRLLKGGVGGALAVTILGVTFKEDVPDCRNTRVIDIIRELETFGTRFQVRDALADTETVEREYGVRLCEMKDLHPAKAVILAVPHRCYRDTGWSMVKGLLEDSRGLVTDVRGCLDRTATPAGVSLWRL